MNRYRSILTSFLLVLILTSFCTISCFSQAKKINNQELIQLMDKGDLQLVDVRTPEETSQGMIEGAQNINFRDQDFKTNMLKLDKTKPVAVYCGSGGRSGQTSSMLEELGFQEIYDLSEGFSNWQEEGNPAVTPPETAEQ